MATPHKKSKPVPRYLLPLIVVLVCAGLTIYVHAATLVPVPVKPATTTVRKSNPVKPAAKSPAPVAAAPAPVVAPKPVAAPVPQTSVKPKVAVRTAAKPAPVAIPAPNSSVPSLAPTSPSGSSGSTGQASNSSQTTGYTSTNWSGYLDTVGSFTAVSASWKVPSVTGNGHSASGDSTWIGIGGVTTDDLIQIGTSNSVSASGVVSPEAFYELLPAVSQPIQSLPVNPGDSISTSINEISANQWLFYIVDQTSGLSYTQTVSYTSSHSSAEWIEEDPSYSNGRQVPFDNFGSAAFTAAEATVNGTNNNLTAINAQPVTMVSSRTGAPVATPSAIGSDGASFSVTAN